MNTSITTKDLHMAIKRGETSTDFAKRHNLEKRQLFDYIRKITPDGANSLIKGLEKNEKVASKRTAKKAIIENEIKVEDEKYEEEVIETVNDENQVQTDSNEETVENREKQLAELRESEKELSQELCKLEILHNQFVAYRRSIIEELKGHGSKLLELQEKLLEEESTVAKLKLDYESLAEKMTSNTAERQAFEQLLTEVRQRLNALEKISILVYSNGNLDCDDKCILDIPEQKVAENVSWMIEMPEAEEFTLKVIKTMAKVKVLCMQSNSSKLEIVFEEESMGRFWKKLMEVNG